ncbi:MULTISPECIES: vWA domain-containing protein [unclassified Akkermansia]|jgi:von willebrand factor type A domain protein|uniref:vWA domain-containing protein n=1 Tax=unclassified Akkermansia TaxID=2608915 RepID=UPI001BFF57A5|nr:VWA domain-containing protein [Akkermansia muciniphila]MBT8774939.1 VWA domain-containing protein [Akkermansia muciniphila]
MSLSSTQPNKQEQLASMREFSNNTNARLPVLFLLDTSGSMNGIVRGDHQQVLRQEHSDGINWNIVTGDNLVTRMDELNTGLQRFISDILVDPLAKLAADVAVITFARTTTTVKEFGPIRESDSELKITTSQENETLLGEVVELALTELDNRKRTYQEHGVEYYQPWLIVMTDGVPTSTRHRELQERLKELSASRKLSVFVFGIGRADLSELSYISPGRPPMQINDQKFPELFAWLSRSFRMVSMSMPGDGVSLAPPPDDVWRV